MPRPRKPIRIEEHAWYSMGTRKISEEQVEKTIRNPDSARPANIRIRKRLEKRISARRRLAVIVEETEDVIRVVTAFWIRKK